MRWFEITESHKHTRIEFDFDDGMIDGFVTDSKSERVDNWLYFQGIKDESFIADLRKNYPIIAYIHTLQVDEASRGEGIGSDLLESFEDDARSRGATGVMLIADANEEQVPGFDLIKWYESKGFKRTKDTYQGPLMIKSL